MGKLISLGVVVLTVAGCCGVVAAAGPTTVSTPSAQPATVWTRAEGHCAYATVGVGIVQPVCHR
jgi:hypothetical protein